MISRARKEAHVQVITRERWGEKLRFRRVIEDKSKKSHSKKGVVQREKNNLRNLTETSNVIFRFASARRKTENIERQKPMDMQGRLEKTRNLWNH